MIHRLEITSLNLALPLAFLLENSKKTIERAEIVITDATTTTVCESREALRTNLEV